MTLEAVYAIAEKGVITLIAVGTIVFVYGLAKLFTKHIPTILKLTKDIIKAWQEFVNAMNENTKSTNASRESINKNTVVTDKSFQHQETVLAELKAVNYKFNAHDINALEVKEVVNELIKTIEKGDNSKELLSLLKQILSKLDEFEEWNGIERRDKR